MGECRRSRRRAGIQNAVTVGDEPRSPTSSESGHLSGLRPQDGIEISAYDSIKRPTGGSGWEPAAMMLPSDAGEWNGVIFSR